MPATDETRRRPALAIAALAVLLVMAAAASFARSDQSLRLADDAIIVRDAERGQAAVATYRANLTIAVVATATESTTSAQRALEAAERALERVADATSNLPALELGEMARTLDDSHERVTAAVDASDVARADRIVSTETLPVLDALQRDLSAISAAAESRIEAEQASAGRTARISSFLVALVVPMLALWVYRRSVQRRMEQDRLAAELARQRDLATAQQSLISGMSHQLRTPLTGIYGFAEALVSDAGLTSDPVFVHEAGTTILSEANRLRGMVDDILVTARNQAGDLAFEQARFPLVAEVDAAVDPFRRIGATIDFDCDKVELLGDRQRLRHVLRNLIDNALRHGLAPVHIIGRLRPNGYDLTVIDHGAGPPAGDLFRTFVHSGEDALVTGSLGLGLGVCRALCDGMGVALMHERADDTTRFNLRFDDPLVLAGLVAGGQALLGRVIGVDRSNREQGPKNMVSRPLVELELDDPCPMPRGSKMFWTERPGKLAVEIVDMHDRHVTLKVVAGMQGELPRVGTVAAFADLDLGRIPLPRAPQEIPWTHVGADSPVAETEVPE